MTPRDTRLATTALSVPRSVVTVSLSWLAIVGVDLSLHAGVLAPLYDWSSPFLVSPGEAFGRIPIGYLALLILAVSLAWLLARLNVEGGRDGARIGGAFGAVIGGALLLGLWSVSTAHPAVLAGWWIAQTVELAIGGAVIGSIRGGVRVRTVAWRVAVLIVIGAISAVVLQTIGYASAPVLVQ